MIKDIYERNKNVTIDSIRKEKMKDFIGHFTDINGNGKQQEIYIVDKNDHSAYMEMDIEV